MPGSGRKQRRSSKNGRNRRPDLSRFYRRKIRDVTPGEFKFECILYRPEAPKRRRVISLERATEQIDWTDSRSALTGSVTLRRPEADPRSLPVIERGHRIRCNVRWERRRVKLWDMRIEEEPSIDLGGGTMTLPLKDDLAALGRSKRDWEFRKDKKHPHGWKAHEIVKDVARRLNVRLGRVSRGEERIKKLQLKDASGLEVIKKAYAEEADKTARRYVIRMRDGRLTVEEFERSRVLFGIRNIELSALTEAVSREGRPQTVIKGSARVNGKKEEVTISRPEAVKRLGRVVKEKDYGRLDSREELKEKAQQELRKQLKVKRTASLTIPGVPFLERGTTVRWTQKERGWHGPSRSSRNRQYAFVTEATHTVSPGTYETSLQLSQRDPYLADKRRRDQEKRDEKRSEKGKKGKKN